jgi:hypothetical protein
MIGTSRKRLHPKVKPRSILLEDLTRSKPERVDRDAGIIYGVKVIGLQSENGRRYTSQSLADAKQLYENLVVNIDHPTRTTDSRSAHDRLGKLVNVRLTEDGLYADLHILKSHPMAERLLEAAENMPDLFGMSHNALGIGPERDGILIVEKITEVKSVDLVADPASTKSLFESRNRPMKKKLRAILESFHPALPKKQAKAVKRLLEDDDVPLDMEMEAPVDEPSAGSDWRGALSKVLADLMATEDPEAHEIGSKIHGMLKIKNAPATETPATEDEEEEPADDDEEEVKEEEDDEEEKDAKESRKPRRRRSTSTCSIDRAIDLCEEHKVTPDKPLLKTLCKLTEAEAKDLLGREKRLTEERSSWHDRPRSQGRLLAEDRGNKNQTNLQKFPNSRDEVKNLIVAN